MSSAIHPHTLFKKSDGRCQITVMRDFAPIINCVGFTAIRDDVANAIAGLNLPDITLKATTIFRKNTGDEWIGFWILCTTVKFDMNAVRELDGQGIIGLFQREFLFASDDIANVMKAVAPSEIVMKPGLSGFAG